MNIKEDFLMIVSKLPVLFKYIKKVKQRKRYGSYN